MQIRVHICKSLFSLRVHPEKQTNAEPFTTHVPIDNFDRHSEMRKIIRVLNRPTCQLVPFVGY